MVGVPEFGRKRAEKMLARWPVIIVPESLRGCGESWAAGASVRVSGVQMQILV
jgi:hypothetical protein